MNPHDMVRNALLVSLAACLLIGSAWSSPKKIKKEEIDACVTEAPVPDHWIVKAIRQLKANIADAISNLNTQGILMKFIAEIDCDALNKHFKKYPDICSPERFMATAFKNQVARLGFEAEHDPNFQLILGKLGDQVPAVVDELRELNNMLGIPNQRCHGGSIAGPCETSFVEMLRGLWKLLPFRMLIAGDSRCDKRITEVFKREEIKLALVNFLTSRPMKEARVVATASGYGFECFVKTKYCPGY